LPGEAVAVLGLEAGGYVNIDATDGKLTITPAKVVT
jgi:hypothetical protein